MTSPSEPSPAREGPPSDGLPTYRRPGGTRVVVVAFAISLVVHVVAVVLYPVFMDRVPVDVEDPDLPPVDRDAQELVRIAPIAPELEEPEAVPEAEVPEPPEVALPEPLPEDEPEVDPRELAEPVPVEEEALPAVERLRPRMGPNPELWTFTDPEALELTPQELAELRIRVAIHELGDSLTAEEERRLDAVDWTYTDDDGEEWGISPGTIHLGEREIPLPFAFTPPPGQQGDVDAMELELWEFGPAQRIHHAREAWRDRIEAIRERRDSERADSTRQRP